MYNHLSEDTISVVTNALIGIVSEADLKALLRELDYSISGRYGA